MSDYKLPEELVSMIEPEIAELQRGSAVRAGADHIFWHAVHTLHNKFRRFAQTTLLEKWEYQTAFRHYLEEEWDIGRTQQFLYLRIARHAGLANSRLSAGRAIVLCGYDDSTVLSFRKQYGDEKIARMSVRELKKAIERQPSVIARRKLDREKKQQLKQIQTKAMPNKPSLSVAHSTLMGPKKPKSDILARAEDIPTTADVALRFQATFEEVMTSFRQVALSDDLQQTISEIVEWSEQKRREMESITDRKESDLEQNSA